MLDQLSNYSVGEFTLNFFLQEGGSLHVTDNKSECPQWGAGEVSNDWNTLQNAHGTNSLLRVYASAPCTHVYTYISID